MVERAKLGCKICQFGTRLALPRGHRVSGPDNAKKPVGMNKCGLDTVQIALMQANTPRADLTIAESGGRAHVEKNPKSWYRYNQKFQQFLDRKCTCSMMSERDLIDFFLQSDLLRPGDIVDREVYFSGSSRRNKNQRVHVSGSPSFFVKQQSGGQTGNGTLAREVAVYRFLSQHEALPRLRKAIPRCFTPHEPSRSMVVLDLTPNAVTLFDYHRQRRSLSKLLFRQLGSVMSELHSIDLSEIPSEVSSSFRPLPFDFCELPASIVFDASMGNLELVRLVQSSPPILRHLNRLREEWHPVSLIHGDLKSDNLLASATMGASRKSRLTVVDWEFCSLGEPLWDVGSVLADCISMWIDSIPLSGDMTEEMWVEFARFPLKRMEPAISCFWSAYFRSQLNNISDGAILLKQAIGYSAARILQFAYESTQTVTNVDGRAACYVQIAENLFERPLEAAVQLFGISPDARRWFDEPVSRSA